MSILAKLSFGAACAFTITAVSFVHYRQVSDRQLLHQGIDRDLEMQRKRKIANQYALQAQLDITRRLQQQREGDAQDRSDLATASSNVSPE